MEELYFCPHCMEVLGARVSTCPACGKSTDFKNKDHQLPVFSILHGRYVIGRYLGEGGFGITYIGYDLNMKQKVAIKEFYVTGISGRSHSLTVKTMSQDYIEAVKKSKDRFLDEAKTLAMFTDEPNIVGVKDYFDENNTAYIVMEYLEGQDLKQFLKENGPQDFDTVFALLRPVMEALCKVHQKGLIHRDISPANIMLMPDGKVKLLDFGTARVQSVQGDKSLTVALKHGFAPLEQYMAHGKQGAWTDVYAMTATFYQLLTGKVPPQATTRGTKVSTGEADPLKKPSELGVEISKKQEAVLLQGLAVNHTKRIQRMEDLIAGLSEAKTAATPITPVKSAGEEAAKKIASVWKSKRTLLILLISVCAVLLLGVGAFTISKMTVRNNSYVRTAARTLAAEEDGKWDWEKKYMVVKETYTLADGGDIDHTVTYAYDRRGWETSSVYESSGGSYYFKSETTYEYDNDGNIRSWTNVNSNGEKTVKNFENRVVGGEERKYTVDEDGNDIEYSVLVEEDKDHRTRYVYTPEDELLEYTDIAEFDDGRHWTAETYDASGILTRAQDTYEDKHGNTLKRENINFNNNQRNYKYIYEFTYDNEQRIISGIYSMYSGTDFSTLNSMQKIAAEYELMDVLVWHEE